LTRLTHSNATFDAIVSCDCLEHIPNYSVALDECRRVLRPGGILLLSAPFRLGSQATLVRAVNINSVTQHLAPPEFHGDPVKNSGILCYYHFGWSLLDAIRISGFRRAHVIVYASIAFGYLGGLQSAIVARA